MGNDSSTPEPRRQYYDNEFTEKIQIAISGRAGVGKSTLINTLRGLEPDDHRAAEVGIIETTRTRTKYPHPTHTDIILWDLPGIGTPTQPSAGYSDRMRLGDYDAVLIVSCSRFTEEEAQLARDLNDMDRTIVFVRSKFDLDVINDQKANRRQGTTVAQTRSKIYGEIKTNLRKVCYSLENVPTFFVDCEEDEDYEFPALKSHIFQCIRKSRPYAKVSPASEASCAIL